MSTLSDLIRKILSKNKAIENKFEIIRYSDQLKIKKKEEFQSYELAKIEEHITRYSKILKNSELTKRDLTSTRNFDNMDIYNELKRIVSLTTKIFVDEKDKFLEDKSELKKSITSKKYNLYKDEIERLENDLTYRLVALKEICKTKKIKSKRNLELLNQELENLSVGLLSFRFQKEAINMEEENYNTILQNKIIDESEVDSYYNKLLKDSKKVLLFEEINEIERMKIDKIERIAYIEKKLEIFFYNNSKYIDILILRLNKLEEIWNSRVSANLTHSINDLEEDFIFCEKYGVNIDNTLKERLYKLKFNIITHDYKLNESNLLSSEDSDALIIYKNEVFKRIENIIKDKNNCLIEVLNSGDLNKNEIKKVKRLLKEIFKDKYNGFKEELILNNIYKLQLLVALDSKEQLINWFKRDVDRKKFLGDEINSKFFKDTMAIIFHDYIPIETICYVYAHSNEPEENFPPLVKLFITLEEKFFSHIIHNKIICDEFYIPEGIKSIRILDTTLPKYSNPEYAQLTELYKKDFFSQKLIENMKKRTVVFPKSLKKASIDGNIHYWLEFQNGVESIYYNGFLTGMIIPPSVKKLEIKSEPSKEFESYVDRTIDEIESSYLKEEIEKYCDEGVMDSFMLYFTYYPKSQLLREQKDFIKTLPNMYKFWIQLYKEDVKSFELKKDIFVPRLVEYSNRWEYEFEGDKCNHKNYLRKKFADSKIRDAAEKKLQKIMNSIEDRERVSRI